MSLPWRFLFLVLVGALMCAADLKKYDLQKNITCSQGLSNCRVSRSNSVVPPRDFGPVEVLSFDVETALCCRAPQKCRACLRIRIRLRILDDDDVSGETPEVSEDGARAAITLSYTSAPNLQSYKRINFTVKSDTWTNQESEVTVVVHEGVFLGSSVSVTVNNMSRDVHFPQHNSVCPSDVEECKTPRIFREINRDKGVVELKAEPEEMLVMCVKRKGMGSCWLSDRIIPLHAVTHCMCFQAWRENREYDKSYRSESCPFEDDKEFSRNAAKNMSLSVGHSETNEGRPALSWNMSAPCRLEAEVWPCQMAVTLGGGCREVPGFRRNISTGWEENISMVWTSGAFLDVRTTNNLQPCVMFKVDGETFGPVCEREASRGRWICVMSVTLLISVLFAVGVLVFRSRIEEWLSNSSTTHQSRGLRGEVLLVYSSGSDPSLSETVCWFATWLSELGFSVSLDLWNRAPVSAMGPTPWLHSRFQHVQKQGGKTLLLLSHDAVLRAKACYESWSGVSNREDGKASNTPWAWNADVFSSALSALFSARLQGGAAEHFALVQLESETLDIPELFQGLRLYQLPSESQRLLADLHTGRPGSFGARLKRFLWTWRASARLEKRLRNREKERWSCTTLPQVEEETLPLRV
ncbi:uncharacterized protein il17rc [Ictalurus furcatus]|uniref:uncharacterized protein il17rc n=1 Tax=Ictalurus furcatus TaxID=66913 RepID=UPI00234FF0DF|nr:uncharacterized protein il17rc [Ictalurus furcatus]XP_053509505.1 uncharacterized protein il17rc [Ictalurus furcatus]